MKLEHLSPYLPYGLKMECHTTEEIKKHGSYVTKLFGLHLNGVDDEYGNNWDLDVKPILRPLSDLTKEIEHNGEKFVPIEKIGLNSCSFFHTTYLVNKNGYEFEIKKIPYNEFQKLFEWHFDVFGLIEKGEAIDINTI